MAVTNGLVGRALELLRDGLQPFVERELTAKYGERWPQVVTDLLTDSRLGKGKGDATNDVAVLLVLMDRKWSEVFRPILGKTERSLVNELLETRKRWAHQELFSNDDAYRALDSAERLLTPIAAPQAGELSEIKLGLRMNLNEQPRGEKRKSAAPPIEGEGSGRPAMGKYAPLYEHLTNLTARSAPMTFAAVEAVLGFKLPQSAREYPAWWANEPPETTRHRHSRAWTLAGRIAIPNLSSGTVVLETTSD